jgi:transglutaminase-like putative cysteine protease
MASTSLLERMVDPISRVLTPEAAREILQVRADEETQQRIDELADKCTEGSLTAEERAEYQSFVSWFNLLTLLQAKARTLLTSSD